jgi:hypothetical protein
MSRFHFDHLWEFLANIEPVIAMLWIGLAAFTVGFTLLLYTRWGQYKPLRMCIAMSLLAHLLLAGYAATVEVAIPLSPPPEHIIRVTIGDGAGEPAPVDGHEPEQPWEMPSSSAGDMPKETSPDRVAAEQPVEPKQLARDREAPPQTDPLADRIAPAEASPHVSSGDVPAALLPQIVMLPKTTDSDAPEPLAAPSGLKPVERISDKPSQSVVPNSAYANRNSLESDRPAAALVSLPKNPTAGDGARPSLPDAYRLRVAPDRVGVAQSRGGTVETEAAVNAALKWLADNQSADGRWDPRIHDAGKETNAFGQNRQNAGSRADTAISGLALLAFLASGHTQLDGVYHEQVRRGVEYLIRNQAPDGNLAGQAVLFESMYCHAMAACALSEAFGMTHDVRLREPVRKAVAYTIAAQDAKGGGWRYQPGEPGDTSQLGWQLMSLKSAELAGIPVPDKTRQGIVRYLQSVSSGKYGGRASYRPGEQATRSMTAEALVCWQFLGLAREHPACNEAGDFLMGELPGNGASNLYYWYYGTLSMYQLQGVYWQRWNEALRANLLGRQAKEGALAGSWDTNDLWGGHGGRVYTTATATLALEVYYRFLPLYAGAQ